MGSVFELPVTIFAIGVALLMRFCSRFGRPREAGSPPSRSRDGACTPYNSLMLKHFVLAAALVMPLAACDPDGAAAPASIQIMTTPMTDLAGRPTTLAPYRGRPLVINFWAPWCDPCRREIPDLVAERRRLRAQGLEVVGIALESDIAAVRQFVARQSIDYPVLTAGEQGIALMQNLGNVSAGLPYTVVLDREGQIRAHKLGALSRKEMTTAFAAALN